MKTTIQQLCGFLTIIILTSINACEKADPASTQADIVQLVLTLEGKDKTITFNDKRQATLIYEYPAGSSEPTEIIVKSITLSKKATANLKAGQSLPFTDNKITLTVTAEDKSTKNTYTIAFELIQSTSKAAPPDAPDIKLKAGTMPNTEITVTITPPEHTGLQADGQTVAKITGYRIEYADNNQFNSTQAKNLGTQLEDIIQGLQSDTEYFVRATATNSAGLQGVYSKTVRWTTAATADTIPGSPGIMLKAGKNPLHEIDAIITLPANTGRDENGSVASINGITVVYAEEHPGAMAKTISAVAGSDTEITITLSDLLSGTPYLIYATVNNSAGLTSNPSDTVMRITTVNPSSPNLPGLIALGSIPSELLSYDEITQEVFEPYESGATVVARYATETGNGDKSGYSWENAASVKELKASLNSIIDAGTNKVYLLLLASGTYKVGEALSMKNHVAIVGGWGSKGRWTRTATDTTVLSGEDSHRVFNNSNLDHTAVLHSLKITKGVTSNNGGGMQNSNASPTLTNITFLKNSASNNGGGIYNDQSSPRLVKTVFMENNAKYGGGMCNNDNRANPTIHNSRFQNNVVSFNGGGMWNNNSAPTITYTSFLGNSAGHGGGGVANNFVSSSITFDNVTISENTAKNGGGMHNHQSSPMLTDVVLANNKANQGGGMYNTDNSTPTIIGAAFLENTAQNGGGMYNEQSFPTLANITFSENSADNNGGGIYNDESSPVITNVTLAKNTASKNGGGMFNDNDNGNDKAKKTIVVVNSLFWGNTAQNGGKQIALLNQENFDIENITLAYNVIEGGADSAAFAIAENGESVNIDAVGTITKNPLLETLTDNGGNVPTMRIPSASPAKNVGLYVSLYEKGSLRLHSYSLDNKLWYSGITANGLTQPSRPEIGSTIALTATDATGTARTDQPDAGAYEAR